VNEPIRLFLVSPALAIRRALARSLDAEADILVVGEARSAVDALARAPAVRPHVVLTGAHLRDPDTSELCRRLNVAIPGVHILVVGVNAGRELVADLISSGAVGVVPHTIDDKELIDAIRTAAAGRMVLSTDAFMDLLQGHAKEADDPLEVLTPLERELFDLVGEGRSNAEIAERLHLSPGTVRNYVSRLLRKLQVERRAQLVVLAARLDSTLPSVEHDQAPDP
jgi:two-component system, NarL family, response regulator DevR